MTNISKFCCGLASDTDALRYRRVTGPRKPVVVWNCTRVCNLKCRHCYAASRGTGVPPVQDKTELSTSEAKAMIDDLASFGCPVLLFSGGEPCLRPDLVELMAHAKARGIRVVLSTNGTLITEELAARFAAVGLDYVGVSVDGLPATHDAFRGVPGAFERSLEGVRKAKAAGIKVGFRMTISRGNAAEIPAVFDLMKREGVNRACFYHLVYSGRGSSMVSEDLAHEGTRAAVRTIMDETKAWFAAGGHPEVLTVDNHADGPFVYLELLKENPARAAEVMELLKMNRGNSSGNGIGCVSWDGEVYADQFWRHFSFGNVRARKFSELWSDVSGATEQSELMRRLKDKCPHVKGRCATCRWLSVCGGNFRVRAEAVTGDVWSPDPACYLTDEEIANPGERASCPFGAGKRSTESCSGCAVTLLNGRDARSPGDARSPALRAIEFQDVIAETSKGFFSRLSPTDAHERNLPHWGQDRTLVFITFRLADSLPRDVLLKWQAERESWLKVHPLPWDDETRLEYASTFPDRMEKWLDTGAGACVLRRADCRRVVEEAIEFFNDASTGERASCPFGAGKRSGESCSGCAVTLLNGRDARSPGDARKSRYRLHAYIVMPNHVHVLMELKERGDLSGILHSWKSFTAKAINRILDKKGEVWQSEFFDRLIRNAQHYEEVLTYIRHNADAVNGAA